jgi:hypothetical protein
MTPELYEEIKNEIPNHVGVFIGSDKYFAVCKKNAKKQLLGEDEDILKISMIRSMNRDVEKNIKSGDKNIIGRYKRKIEDLQGEIIHSHESYNKLRLEDIELQKRIRELENQIKENNG